jgi:hypothetical protein
VLFLNQQRNTSEMNSKKGKRVIIAISVIFVVYILGNLWLHVRSQLIEDGQVITAKIITHDGYNPKGGYWIEYGYQIEQEHFEGTYSFSEPLPCFAKEGNCTGVSIKIRVSNRFPSLSKPIE